MPDVLPDQATCKACRDLVERERGDLPDLEGAALNIAVGALYGGSPCDHVDWTFEDAYRAFEALWAQRGRERDRLRAENEALKAERDRAVETRENANTVSVRVEADRNSWRRVAERLEGEKVALQERLRVMSREVSERLDWIARDRTEPDKVLVNVSTTRSVLIRELALGSLPSDETEVS